MWGTQYEDALGDGSARVFGSEMHCQGAFGMGNAKVNNYILLRRSVTVFAMKCNAKVISRKTCHGGDVKVSCREKHCQIS